MEGYPNSIRVIEVLVVVTLIVHILIPRVFRASVVVAGLCGVIFTILGFVQEHEVSWVPFVFGGLYGFIFALFVGVFFYAGRKLLSRGRDEHS